MTAHAGFESVVVHSHSLIEFANELDYVNGFPKKQFFVESDVDGYTTTLLEASNYRSHNYAKLWRFEKSDLIEVAQCYSGHGCMSITPAICGSK